MQKQLYLYFIFICLLWTCKAHQKQDAGMQNSTPACILKKIERFSKESCTKGPNVKEYTFQNKQVFVFDQGNCGNDMTSEVVDAECNTMGYLGGFTGNVKINGEDFEHALLIKLLWEKPTME
jgi:hypothetical protein